MSITLSMCTNSGGECSSRFVITTAPFSIAAATEPLFARTPPRKNVAKNVDERR